MTRHVAIRLPSMNRRQPLLKPPRRSSAAAVAAEVAGGTTAECVAVCCCGPFVVADLLVAAVYRLPARLCRKALRQRRRQRLLKQGNNGGKRREWSSECEYEVGTEMGITVEELLKMTSAEESPEMANLEEEMWKNFYSTGFWRSPSLRELC